MIACLRSKKDEEERLSMRNGAMLLEESISLFDGKVNPICCFSAQELNNATQNFDEKQAFHETTYSRLYRGYLRGHAVIVKKFFIVHPGQSIIRDIVIASRMSVHKNVLKLIGCYLETELPILVFESVDCDGALHDRLYDPNRDVLRTWKDRLKIAADVSNVVAYLHTALPRPLIYKHLSPWIMLLDKESSVVKLFDFSSCVPLPEGESYIEDTFVSGTMGFLDPEYFRDRRFNEKADVYGFGVILLILLSGQRTVDATNGQYIVNHARNCKENERFEEILEPLLSEEEPWPGKDGQFKAFATLALQCTRDRADDRPDITDVARQLGEMYLSLTSDS